MMPSDFEFLQNLVRERSAIIIESGKEYLVEARLDPIVREEELPDLSALVTRLRASGSRALQERVVEAMTTNETSFFRDHHPFELLRTQIFPELIKKRANSRRLNIWCAACSSGQEPYSIAMMIREHLPSLAGWSIQILASDLSQTVLERARAGTYSQLEVNRGLPATSLVKFFKQSGKTWVLKDEIRRMVDFQQINLVGTWPALPTQDVIFLRNVMIYFDLETKQQIFSRLRGLLAPDGYLFLGSSETVLSIDDFLERIQFDHGSCYRPRQD